MTISKRLAAHRASAPDEDPEVPSSPAAPDENETPENPKKKDDPMPDETENKAAVDAARTEGHGAGFKAANERMGAVFASEHYTGREAMAAKLLGKPAMTAEDIIDVLADTPKAETSKLSAEELKAAAEEAGRKEMKSALIDWYGEEPVPGQRDDNSQLWASDQSGTWTLVKTLADGNACVLAQGDDWMAGLSGDKQLAALQR